LPKLTLSVFNGEITQWQTFWDCFELAVHTNETVCANGETRLRAFRREFIGASSYYSPTLWCRDQDDRRDESTITYFIARLTSPHNCCANGEIRLRAFRREFIGAYQFHNTRSRACLGTKREDREPPRHGRYWDGTRWEQRVL